MRRNRRLGVTQIASTMMDFDFTGGLGIVNFKAEF